MHAVTGQPSFSNLAFAVDGADLVATFRLAVDGVAATNFTEFRSNYRFDGTDRFDILPNSALVNNLDGSYRVTIAGGAAVAAANNRYMLRIRDLATRINVIVSGDFPGSPHVDLVSSQACANCHGGSIAAHYGYNVGDFGADELQCTVCHSSSYIDTRDPNQDPGHVARGRFFKVVHGVHNSHNMPSGEYVFNPTNIFSVTYPTYMTNCSVCHDDPASLTAANAMPVTTANCFSCHESMESWAEAFAAKDLTFHDAFTETTNCLQCHNSTDGIARSTVAQMHNGLETERVGLIWNGEDLSVTEGKKFTWQITNIVDNGATLAISWTATYNNVAVNPCNATIGPNAPGFHAATNGGTDGSLGMLRSYAQGDDFILGTSSSAPGQPSNVNLNTTNTVCAGNVATTTLPVEAGIPAGTRGIVALQGKPQLPLPSGFNPATMDYEWPALYVRVPTPTREWVVGSGDLPVASRRAIVDTTQCLKCHVGSLYQHGNTRVDNVGMCILCHNSASNEKNVRVGMGVDPSEAYDGKSGQTFEMKTLLHRVHSVGTEALEPLPVVIYRTRGIYAWAPEGVTPPNWPTGVPDADGKLPVFGATGPNALQIHNLYHPTYPRAANDCAACHGDISFDIVPKQSKAVATTTEAGGTVWADQFDDELMGSGAAACTSCHQSSAAKGHAFNQGWEPSVFPEGRKTILDAATR
jgi:OmcA/MtrC family decaheme c-type cytochrome